MTETLGNYNTNLLITQVTTNFFPRLTSKLITGVADLVRDFIV